MAFVTNTKVRKRWNLTQSSSESNNESAPSIDETFLHDLLKIYEELL